MSASEKLRALYIPDMGEFDFRVADVRDALPLIADVVEAAEALLKRMREGGPYERREAVLTTRLTALREHLDAQ